MNLDPHLAALLRHFRLDRTYVRGRGSWLEDDQGRRVLDLSSQYGALPFGHNPDGPWEALEAVRRAGIPAMVQPSIPVLASQLAARLARAAPVGNGDAIVTFMQSGAEAIEVALRMCRLATGRPLVVAAERGYHGKTLGAAALSWGPSRELDPAVRPPGFLHVPWNDPGALERLLAERGDQVAALVLEPVQGEGGVFEADPGYFARARALCDRHGVLLVLDEVQTGLGRLGTLFGAELVGVRPDVLVLSKALGGGLVPLAAVIATTAVHGERFSLGHGSTFANNNLTCAVGLSVLDALERDGALQRVRTAGMCLRTGLDAIGQRYPGTLRAIRGRGCLFGIELQPPGPESSFLLTHLAHQGAWPGLLAAWLLETQSVRVIPCLTHDRALRLQPALDVSDEDLARGLAAVEALVRVVHLQDWAALLSPLIGQVSNPIDARSLRRPIVTARLAVEGETPSRFAFLLHHTRPEDLAGTSPALARLGPEGLRALYDWTAAKPGHAPACFMPAIRGAPGSLAQGWLITVTHTPESIRERPRQDVSREIARAVAEAERLGAQVIGLGAFTSIATANGAEVAREGGPAITTGSALTVAMAIDGVRLACDALELERRRLTGLVLGLGVIGSATVPLLAELLPSLVLVGNPARADRDRAKAAALMDATYAGCAVRLDGGEGVAFALRELLPVWRRLGPRGRELVAILQRLAREPGPCEGLAAEIAWACEAAGRRAPLSHAADLSRAIGRADVIVSATSAAQPLIGPCDLKPGAIVCDVAKPADVSRSVAESRDDVLVFDGGLVRWREPLAFGTNLGHPGGLNLACLTETVVLALERVTTGRFGVGLAADLPALIPMVREAAARHGFTVGELRQGERVLTPSDVAAIAASAFRLRERRPARGGVPA